MSVANEETIPVAPGKAINITIWVVQVLFSVVVFMGGFMKVMTPIDELAKMMSWVGEMPWLPRFVGTMEVLGALGLLLPSITRIKPMLTPLAAAGIVTIHILAASMHATRGEWSMLPVNLIFGAIAAFVIWGRWEQAPLTPRN